MSFSTLAAGAEKADMEAFLASAGGNRSQQHDASLKAYFRELKKVISLSDVLLQVLDARDPLGSRSTSTERLILSQGKRIVFILNKVDLVPQENVLAWLKYLRNDFPTLAFKSSTQLQRNNLAQKQSASGSTALAPHQQTQAALGAQSLISLLKNYSRSLNLKTSLTVGIFGAPNVGKSSLINSLKRARVCSVASTPGHTKVMQGVMLDKHVRLLDCPGIVFADAGDKEHESVVQLRNVIKVESVEDPTVPVSAILSRVPLATLRKLYNTEVKSRTTAPDLIDPSLPVPDPDAQDFLLRLALQRGRLNRGGIPDTDAMGRSLLHDWNTGKIPFYTNPPKLHRSAFLSKDKKKEEEEKMDVTTDSIAPVAAAAEAESGRSADAQMDADELADGRQRAALEDSAAIVSQFSEAFDLAGLLGEADAELMSGTGAAPPPPASTESASQTADGGKGHSDPDAPKYVNGKPVQTISTLGKRRRGGNTNQINEETADEPAWKSRQRHRAQSARSNLASSSPSTLPASTTTRPLAPDSVEHNVLSRANLKKTKKKAKRRTEVEQKEGMSGPGGLLDQLELAFSLDPDEDGELDGNEDDRMDAAPTPSKAPPSAAPAPKRPPIVAAAAPAQVKKDVVAAPAPPVFNIYDTKADEDDEEW